MEFAFCTILGFIGLVVLVFAIAVRWPKGRSGGASTRLEDHGPTPALDIIVSPDDIRRAKELRHVGWPVLVAIGTLDVLIAQTERAFFTLPSATDDRRTPASAFPAWYSAHLKQLQVNLAAFGEGHRRLNGVLATFREHDDPSRVESVIADELGACCLAALDWERDLRTVRFDGVAGPIHVQMYGWAMSPVQDLKRIRGALAGGCLPPARPDGLPTIVVGKAVDLTIDWSVPNNMQAVGAEVNSTHWGTAA